MTFGTRPSSEKPRALRWYTIGASPFADLEPLDPPRLSGVYVVLCGDRVKIGVADNIRARLQHIRAMCPYEVRLLAVMRGDAELEATLHERFAASRLHCEWFAVTEDLVSLVVAARSVDPNLEDRPARRAYERIAAAAAEMAR